MHKERKDKHFIQKPVYPGGNKALRKFVNQQLQYPPQARENKIEGTVILRYTINHLGKVGKVKLISGLGYGCDEEAIRVVKLLEFRAPKKVRGMKVSFHRDIKVHFNRSHIDSSLNVQYHFVPKEKNKKPSKPSTGNSHGYSISF